MTPEPIKALAELRALSDAATPGPWYFEDEPVGALLMPRFGSEGHRRGVGDYAFGTVYPDIGEDQAPTGADLAFIVALVNAFRADPAALLSLVPRDGVSEVALGEALHHWRHPDHAGKPGWGICDCMAGARSIAADYRLILNRDTGSAEPEPLRFDLVGLLGNIAATQGRLVPPTGPYVLVRDIYAAFGAEAAYDAIAGGSAEPGEGPVE